MVEETIKSFKGVSLQGAIIQEGVRKKKRAHADYSYDRLPPKPVILGVKPEQIKDYVYVVIRPALHTMLKRMKRFGVYDNFYDYPVGIFKEFIPAINKKIKELYPNWLQYRKQFGMFFNTLFKKA